MVPGALGPSGRRLSEKREVGGGGGGGCRVTQLAACFDRKLKQKLEIYDVIQNKQIVKQFSIMCLKIWDQIV